jgi:hypothetical protein
MSFFDDDGKNLLYKKLLLEWIFIEVLQLRMESFAGSETLLK